MVRFSWWAALLVTATLGAQDAAAPVIPSLWRDGVEPRVRGEVLLNELGCRSCHGGQTAVTLGPDLAGVGERADPAWIEEWLAQPHRVRPGTTMPDQLGDSSPADRAEIARALTAFLTQGAPRFRREAHDPEAAARGHELFQSIGCAVCHAPRQPDSTEIATPDSQPLGDLRAKYSADSLRRFLLDPHSVRKRGRMPKFDLAPREAYDLAQFLTTPRGDDATAWEVEADDALIDRGRRAFETLRCAQCHEGTSIAPASAPATPLEEADLLRGCLSDAPARQGAPDYHLNDLQRGSLRAALLGLAAPLTADQQIQTHLTSRNCIACHERGELGGVLDERDDLFGGTDLALGTAGRIPPPLTQAGAKLQDDWLERSIAYGQRERPYLNTRMPGFGADLGAALTPLLVAADRIADAPQIAALPDDRDSANEIKDLGKELVGDKGMGCIACHTFAGQNIGAMHAIDLVASTGQRLRPEWFRRYMLAPTAYRSSTIMPQFFIGDASTRPDLGDGKPESQIAGLWHYLSSGRNVRRPSGLRNEPIELTVDDRAVILRRAVQNTGKRGISVGYPGGVNFTFDAETLAMNQIWWGRFLDVAPVFHGQGSGQAHIPTRDRADLGRGPAFVGADFDEQPEPEKLRRAPGHRLLGYDLDDRGRPAFRYRIDDTLVHESSHEAPLLGGGISLNRMLTLVPDTDRELTFRVAHGAEIRAAGDDRTFRIGDRLQLQIVQGPDAVLVEPTTDRKEIRMPLRLTAGTETRVTLSYRWTEEGR